MSKKFRLARAASPIALAGCLAFAFSSAALAGNDWNHRWGHDNGWHGNNHNSGSYGIYLDGPVYYAPRPTYYAPPPVYYAPAPAYYGAPGYYAPQPSVGLQFNIQ